MAQDESTTSAATADELRATVEGFGKRRLDLVRRAAHEWRNQLVDLGARNNLLRYRELKRGTLELTPADPQAIEALLRGRSVRLSRLFPNVEELDTARRRVRVIHKKEKENFEERGIETLHLGAGLASWQGKSAWEPLAPILIRRAELRPLGAAQDDFEITLTGEMEFNPTLVHVLKSDFSCEVDPERLLDRIDGVIDEPWELRESYAWLLEHGERLPGLRVEERLVLANFSYAKLPMVRDLEGHLDELMAHDLIAAIAGDEDARESVRSAQPPEDAIPTPDQVPPADEFLILDADASQHYAINATLAGESLIVKGPPGTGKSQTIANLIGSLVARGKTVLFVAEKRAAIDAVLKRLYQRRLADIVLDLHGGVASRRTLAQAIGQTLTANRALPRVDRGAEERRLQRERDDLNAYAAALHAARPPWGVSAYEARARLLTIPGSAETGIRIPPDVLTRMDPSMLETAVDELRSLARLGGLGLATSGSPWSAATITNESAVVRAYQLVEGLRHHSLPTAMRGLGSAAATTALPAAPDLAGWTAHLELWESAGHLLTRYRADVFVEDCAALATSLARASKGGPTRLIARATSASYRLARSTLRGLLVEGTSASDSELLADALSAADLLVAWASAGGRERPSAPANLHELRGAHTQAINELGELEGMSGLSGLAARELTDLESLLAQMADDRPTLVRLPEIRKLEDSLRAAGFGPSLDDLVRRQASEEVAVQGLLYVWLRSITEHLLLTDRILGGFSAEGQERTAQDFRSSDVEQIESASRRIRRIVAENATRARDTYKDQESILLAEAAKRRRHRPVKELVALTPELLLALKPCWAMSPLVVSQLLPARPLFDVVVFDEASQITPADAVTSILRGRQLVVAGDERQLPPTTFFASEAAEDLDEDDEQIELPILAGTADFESILDALMALLRFRMLQWHYRSRDERLIAFSNAHIYDRSLTTFPGTGGDVCLRHIRAPWQPGADTNSPSSEVESVVDLVIDHAQTRPGESLGVIAMGIKHANRIEETLRQRLHDHPELDEFFDEGREERFFVKNLERVQGDERDAIILSIGYGKNEREQLVYRFGPLLADGGERRLNVAVTRAKQRLTLVSSFFANDMDPEKLTAEGMKLIRQYLQYVESGGATLGDAIHTKVELNPFEIDVRDTLSRHLSLVPQYGSSGYAIDFVVRHPTREGKYVLAIECDGASYHASSSARDRDRLRQEQLERIGWRFHRIWSTEWFSRKEVAVAKVLAAYEDALASIDQTPPDRREARARVEDANTVTAVAAVPSRSPRPLVSPGKKIDEYSQAELVAIIRWISSDTLLRTQDELLEETMSALGFQRRGSKIVDKIQRAIAVAQGLQRPDPPPKPRVSRPTGVVRTRRSPRYRPRRGRW